MHCRGIRQVGIFLVIVSLLLTGCGGDSTTSISKKSPWGIAVHSVQFTSWVDSDISGYGYSPDPGYDWLLVNISITNTRNTGAGINWLLDDFTLVVGNLHYDQRLHFNYPPGYISTSFNPQQTKSGFIAFEVPKGTSLSNATLRFDPWDGSSVVVSLKGVPVL